MLKDFLNTGVPTFVVVIICVVIWNIVSLFVTLADKRAAERGKWRVPERRFVFFALTFGGIGVLVGFYAAHHKVRKGYLLASVWSLTLVEIAVTAVLLML